MTIEVCERLGMAFDGTPDMEVELDHIQREKGRLKVNANCGAEVRIFLERGNPLLVGESIRSACGKTVLVQGKQEPVITASTDNWFLFSRACYHLGNRHVKLQIGECWLRITPDHVLQDMLTLLGLDTQQGSAIFMPESGAYKHGHSH